MIISNGIIRKLLFPGKVFHFSRTHSKHTFYKGCPFEQTDKEQQPPTEQKKIIKQQNLPQVTPEPYQDAETSSKRNDVKRNDAASGQSTEGGAEAMPGDKSKLQSDHLVVSNKTQQQGNTVVQRRKAEEANQTALGNQK